MYLGYKFRWNGRQKVQMRERVRKAMRVMGQMCEIGRRFGEDWKIRMKLFD